MCIVKNSRSINSIADGSKNIDKAENEACSKLKQLKKK